MTTTAQKAIADCEKTIKGLEEVLNQREYVMNAGVRGKTTRALAKARKQLIELTQKREHNYEPTTPPRQWYCGVLKITAKMREQRFPGRPWNGTVVRTESWPHKPFTASKSQWVQYNSARIHVFTAPIPVDAMHEYDKAIAIFGAENIRVYSPNEADFAEAPAPVAKDPVIIAKDEKGHYFEIARWAIEKDIAFAMKALNKK